ncbi:GNAT family N-acetyltransferase [Haloplasma contractile]|uniref:Ribosomal-protein-alanine acetyltransferase putative n=1 Tax=Haloplasma contractile SSD-17B TaxID=1033810 RepID=U2E9M1_9MOLU|nr:GNAT family N-acetyltransferase [Haloplasma contractile]ERJ11838.1 Ribosomal-protein-alanine acetyltransferase putative [Haloplasma contractile SSD-17B]
MSISIKRVDQYDKALLDVLFKKAELHIQRANPSFFRNHHNILLVAYKNEVEACGFLYAYLLNMPNSDKTKLFLYSIDVFNGKRREGIGTKLIKKLKEIGKVYQANELFVLTNDSNLAAKGLYEYTGGYMENDDDIMYVYDLE